MHSTFVLVTFTSRFSAMFHVGENM